MLSRSKATLLSRLAVLPLAVVFAGATSGCSSTPPSGFGDGGRSDGGPVANRDGGPGGDGGVDGGSLALAIATTSLPAGTVGVAYSESLHGAGGASPYLWALASGSMPAGLTLSSSGVISGTPTAAGSFSFSVKLTDSSSPSQSVTGGLTLQVEPASSGGTLVILTTSLEDGIVGVPYSVSLVAGGGTQPYGWSLVAGSLPPGIALAADGTLAGTPKIQGSFFFTVQAGDGSTPAQTAQEKLGLTVIGCAGCLQVSTAAIPGGTVGSAYSYAFTATGGTQPYDWSIASGALPSGLTLSSGGVLSGTPTAVGSYTFVVQVADGSSPRQSSQKQFDMVVGTAPLTVVTTSLPSGVVGSAYSAAVVANGGASPYTWNLVAGSLPSGLALDAATGTISGNPSSPGSVSFTIQVADASSPQKTAQQALAISIAAASKAMSIATTSPLPDGVTGVPYAVVMQVVGGTAPYSWSIGGGSLPAGLSIDPATGGISGAPAAAGSSSFTVNVTDSSVPTKTTSAPFGISVHAPLLVATASLPAATLNAAYSASVTAQGGLSPYAFSLASGSLPPGLALSSSGAISGTPTATGVYGFAVQISDSANPKQTTSADLSISVGANLAVLTTSLPAGTVGVGYGQTLAALGGTSPYGWSVASGALPPGLGLGASTGVISGTPSTAGSYSFTVVVQDSSSPAQSASQLLGIVISMPAGLTVTTSSLPGAVVGQSYATALNAVSGTTPYGWAVTAGSLPAGLSLAASTGVISGTPTAAGASSFTVTVTDSSSPPQTASAALSIAVTDPLIVTTSGLPGGVTGAAYAATLAASGGSLPYGWSVTSGALPPGLSLDPTTGGISGIPISAGSFGFTIQVVDSSSPQQTASATFSIAIAAGLSIATTGLPGGAVGSAYSATLGASGGTTPYAWSVSSGALPPGLSLGVSTGTLSGIPTAAGSYTFTVTVTDGSSPPQSSSTSFTVVISTPGVLAITTSSLPDGILGAAYGATLTASGGTPPYAWTLISGGLPPGLALTSATGAISGTPSSTGSFSFSVRVTDSSNPQQSASGSFAIVVNAPLTVTTTSLPNGLVGSGYSAALSASGGTSPYGWSISTGTLPPGLSLNGTTGVISGSPNVAGSYAFTAKVTDSSSPQQSATANLSITVQAPLSITTVALPTGAVNARYSATLAATGGATPYAWTVVNGSLPPGLLLDGSTGVISGTPTTRGSYTFTVQVADSSSPQQTAQQQYTLQIQ